ncbi:MAG: hypothetical protein K0R83_2118 [Caulobacter sp.]|jgi:uncharacterized protein (DUF2141 family)|nr:hypothetical protein [Caulobacter sp.]
MFTRSTFAALAACLLSATAVVNAPPAAAQEAGEVKVTFSGIRTPTGALFIGLYDSEAAFGGGQPVGGYRLVVDGDTVSQSIKGLKPGRYALKVYHDVDGDGRMNTNAFGLPTEPYAASNNAPATMGPPAWADAVFEVGAQGAVQTIAID